MTSHEKIRAALLREREARAVAYASAVTEREAMAAFATASDALEYDRRAFARAEARVGLALKAMEDWGDPVPGPAASEISTSAASEGPCSLSRAAGAADPVEATAARNLASDTAPGEGREDAEVDAIARRIAAA